MAAPMYLRVVTQFRQFEQRFTQMVASLCRQDPFPLAMAINVQPTTAPQRSSPDHKSILDSILGDSLLWAVPKKKRSLARRQIRCSATTKMRMFASPRKNLTNCLECGHWHEAHTICGNCYEKVREETTAMRDNMSVDDRLYNAPRSEVVYMYQGEAEVKEKHQGKYIVEMEKPRPEWFAKNLLTKPSGKR